MPEATMHEDSCVETRQHDVRTTAKVAAMQTESKTRSVQCAP